MARVYPCKTILVHTAAVLQLVVFERMSWWHCAWRELLVLKYKRIMGSTTRRMKNEFKLEANKKDAATGASLAGENFSICMRVG
jgi:hypothetical protein